MKVLTTTKKVLFHEVGEARTTYKKLSNNEAPKITNSGDSVNIFRPLFEEMQDTREQFRVMFLNRSNRVICTELIGQGSAVGTVVDVQAIIRTAILTNAQALILCHNHPSGETRPSEADKTITHRVKEAAKLMDIALLDHVILGISYFSFADEGLI